MEIGKQQLLDQTHDRLLNLTLADAAASVNDVDAIAHDEVFGYGTGSNEKVLTKEEFRSLVTAAYENLKGLQTTVHEYPAIRRFSRDENVVVHGGDIEFTIFNDSFRHHMLFRMSYVMEFEDNAWRLLHFHRSVPDTNSSSEDIFHLQLEKERTAALERTVEEKTKELTAKNSELAVEAALEKVRNRSLAMRESKELIEVIHGIFQELKKLEFDLFECSIITYGSEAKELISWTYSDGVATLPTSYRMPFFDHPVIIDLHNDLLSGVQFRKGEVSGQSLKNYLEQLFTLTDFKNSPAEYIAAVKKIDRIFYTHVVIEHGLLEVVGEHPLPEQKDELLKRFAKVFEQAYTRFLDLQKAEQQTREAQVEAALERVRSKTMGMQRSEELSDISMLLFDEFTRLNVLDERKDQPVARATIGIFDEVNQKFHLWLSGLDGKKIDELYALNIDEPTTISKIFSSWKQGHKSASIELKGGQLSNWLDFLNTHNVPVNQGLYNGKRVNNFAFFSKGCLGLTTNEVVPVESMNLLERFAGVFDLTYTRFLDLQQAEERASAAVRAASLDRLRAKIASMRTSADLEQITPALWQELKTLGIPFTRCGVFIMNESREWIECYLSTPEGRSIAGFTLKYELKGKVSRILSNWRNNAVYAEHWGREDFKQIAGALLEQGNIKHEAEYMDSMPAEGLHLHFLPFNRGMLYVGNTSALSQAHLQVTSSLAEAFATAYARYEDFVQLEKAKALAEQTLTKLQAAQQQLIQAEKMASLGELTAGIAHEIQNPLNFVNNFSEMNRELLEELSTGIDHGNLDEVKQLAKDISTNSEKITHHGKRADAIVKGMLQHSRAGSGLKESTNLNALCDEYVRLSYHGLRAKDKSFNAEFKTTFDESMGNVDLVAQDIGRVLLNLFNNAFYAVNEKRKHLKEGYAPMIEITTKREDAKVFIRVRDNGMGIPEKVLNKIYQPFFTTKPTGEGTGLGLSLSYDIIKKGHGGEMNVSTKDGEGSEFIIELPAQA